MRAFIRATILGVAVLGFAGVPKADAHPPGSFYGGFGNGAHDFAPHWHQTNTPFGPTAWYGNGLHDVLPHHHSISPWGGVSSYGITPYGPTTSYNGFSSYGGYYGGYAPSYGGYSGGYAPSYGGYYGGGW